MTEAVFVVHLLTFAQSGLVVNMGGNEGEPMSVRQAAQQQNHCATSTLSHSVIHNLTWERQSLRTEYSVLQ